MTPPKVLGAPKPWSSVIMSSTLGAPFGGTTRGGHQAFYSEAPLLNHAAECRIGRRKLFSGNRGRGNGRAWDTSDLLSQCRDATKGEKARGRKHAATEFHGGKLRLNALWVIPGSSDWTFQLVGFGIELD